eukprot:6901910-Prymnesium_polylepis.1
MEPPELGRRQVVDRAGQLIDPRVPARLEGGGDGLRGVGAGDVVCLQGLEGGVWAERVWETLCACRVGGGVWAERVRERLRACRSGERVGAANLSACPVQRPRLCSATLNPPNPLSIAHEGRSRLAERSHTAHRARSPRP